jgi:predicted Zn-dependent protease
MNRKRIMRMVTGFMLLCLLFWTASCATNPVSGGPELMLLSEQDEISLGGQTDREVRRQYGVYEDAELQAYLDDVCKRLGKLSHRPTLDYRFEILDASVVNAFAVPGGYVYFTRGILSTLNNEAELAGVMGHEIGHVAARHSAQQYSRAQLAQFGVVLGGLFLGDLASGLAQFGVGMLFLSFSRDNERQADALGVEYSSKAGYDAAELARFFETLERMNPPADRSGLPSWFSTHPSPVDREAAVRSMAKEWQQQLGLKHAKVNREVYLKKIDGLVYGEDPRQGYVEDGVFYHPTLRVQFPVPATWKLANTPAMVQMVSEPKDAAIVFSMGAGKSPKEAAANFVSKSGARLLSSDPLTVNGLSAYRLVSDIQSQQGYVRVMSYFISKDKYLYVFHGLCVPSVYSRYDDVFENTMKGFKDLSDPKKIHVQPDRIRIRTAKSAGTLEDALRSMGVAKDELKQTALLNGMELSDPVKTGTLLKVVDKGR